MIKIQDNIHKSYEDYLKAIYLISKSKKGGWVSNSDISKFLKIKPSSVTDMLYKLREKDYINWKPRIKIRLTEKGKIIAKQIIKSFKFLKIFLTDVLNLNDNSTLDEFCCKVEHFLTPQILDALKSLIIEIRGFEPKLIN